MEYDHNFEFYLDNLHNLDDFLNLFDIFNQLHEQLKFFNFFVLFEFKHEQLAIFKFFDQQQSVNEQLYFKFNIKYAPIKGGYSRFQQAVSERRERTQCQQ